MVKFAAFLIILVLLFGVSTMREIVGGAFTLIVGFLILCAIICFINWAFSLTPSKELTEEEQKRLEEERQRRIEEQKRIDRENAERLKGAGKFWVIALPIIIIATVLFAIICICITGY